MGLEHIERDVRLPISRRPFELTREIAQSTGKHVDEAAFVVEFGEKYGETVSVYAIRDPAGADVVSRELCGGPLR